MAGSDVRAGRSQTGTPPPLEEDGSFLLRLAQPVGAVVAVLRDTLAAEGFCVAAEVDLQVVVRVRAHRCLEPYVVLEVLDGRRAADLLEVDRGAGRLLPWHVVVRADRADRAGHGTVVQAPDPVRLARHVDRRAPDPRMLALAAQTRERLARALRATEGRLEPAEVRRTEVTRS
ncbi:MAG TPA: DUF302 domain-containing protein [Motilibacteraceae bacterium]|nr:DUF302 domain-containing protein [Motilibacteraceae bacterium]